MLSVSTVKFNNQVPPIQPTRCKNPSFGIAMGGGVSGKLVPPAAESVKTVSKEFRHLISDAANRFNRKICKEALLDNGYILHFHLQREDAKLPLYEITQKIVKFYDNPRYHGSYKEAHANHILSRVMVKILGIAKEDEIRHEMGHDFGTISERYAQNILTPEEETILRHPNALNMGGGKNGVPNVMQILAEIIASHQPAGGIFGSGLYGFQDKKIMQKLFHCTDSLVESVYLL